MLDIKNKNLLLNVTTRETKSKLAINVKLVTDINVKWLVDEIAVGKAKLGVFV
ncbi:24388_t:CDS:2 [Gigaspora margarita]|uniref:24388_t:CDS:1 n=1 Tax=Gigaspora margarita TaxID=4874 RepID=A0ABN7UL93_GIGMA|nr:24388_t:CDS:2 [Gigaspora margarita]